MIIFALGMTKEELVARLRDIEWDDFEVKAAKSDLPFDVTGRPMCIETSLNSVKVIFDLRHRGNEKADVAKNVAKNVAEKVAKNLSVRRQHIIALISEHPQITRAEIAISIGVSVKTIERDLAALSEMVRYVGPKKGGRWEILSDISESNVD